MPRSALFALTLWGCSLPDTIVITRDARLDMVSTADEGVPFDEVDPTDLARTDALGDLPAFDRPTDVQRCDGAPCPPMNACPEDPGATIITADGCAAMNASSTEACGSARMTCGGTCLRCACQPEVPRVVWARGFSEEDTTEQRQVAKGVAIDDSGNVYVLGRFSNVLRDSAGYVSTRFSGPQTYLAAFTPTGVRRWLHVLGPSTPNTTSDGLLERGGFALTLGTDGDLYLAGPLLSVVTLPGTPSPVTLRGSAPALFAARVERERGEARWIRSLGDGSEARVSQLAVGSDGSYVVSGRVSATPAWGTPGASNDAFVRAYRADGSLAWGWRPPAEGIEVAHGVAVGRDTVVAVGEFDQRIDLGDGVSRSVGTTILRATNGPKSAFIVSLARATGALRWARAIGDSTDRFMAVGLDAAQNVYVGAIIGSEFPFAGRTVTSPNTSGNRLNAAVLSYTADGCERWVQIFGGNENDSVMALTVDPDGTVYAGGAACRFFSFGGEIVRGGGCIASYMVSYDRGGGFRWGRRFGAREDGHADTVYDIAVNRQGRLVVGGGTLAATAGSFILDTFAEGQNMAAGNAGYLVTLQP